MMPYPSPSPDEVDELRKELKSFLKSVLYGPDRHKSIMVICKSILYSAIAGTVIGSLAALGQCLALGTYRSWQLYGRWWIFSPLLGIAALTAIFVLAVFMYVFLFDFFDYLANKIKTNANSEIIEQIGSRVMLTILILIMIALPVFLAYNFTKDENPFLIAHAIGDADTIKKSFRDQSEEMRTLSDNAKTLLEQLDSTDHLLQKTRDQLTATLAGTQTQITAVEKASKEFNNLVDKHRQIQIYSKEVENILEGQSPITRNDLKSSGRTGLVYGTILGFVASLVASALFHRIIAYLHRNKT